MTWQPIGFLLPDAVDGAATSAGAVLDAIAADSSSAAGRLSAATKPTYTKNALATAAASIDNTIDADTQKTIAVAIVHPWSNGIYQQGPIMGFLSARNAVLACAKKLQDEFDAPAISGNIEALTIVISATTYQQLGELLSTFGAVFYLPEVAMLARRSAQVAGIEESHMIIPDAALYPLFTARNTQQLDAIRTAADLLHSKLAIVDAYADQNTTPAQELENLITEKTAHVAQVQNDYAAFSAAFTGGAGSAVFLPAGAAFNQGQLLKQQAALLPEKPLAVAVMMTGQANALALIKEAVGL